VLPPIRAHIQLAPGFLINLAHFRHALFGLFRRNKARAVLRAYDWHRLVAMARDKDAGLGHGFGIGAHADRRRNQPLMPVLRVTKRGERDGVINPKIWQSRAHQIGDDLPFDEIATRRGAKVAAHKIGVAAA